MPAKEIKCVVWDLDDTLWTGILLESESVFLKEQIKGIIIELDARGIIQSICSKNDDATAVKQLKDFGINDYFIYPQISWEPKSVAIRRLQERLRIGMDAIMLVDDQHFERDEVSLAHPDITCFDAQQYQEILSLDFLQPRFQTVESNRRRQMYLEDIQRETDEQEYQGTPASFLRSLHLQFTISQARPEDLPRVEELTIRTNQLNATGLTYSYDELDQLSQMSEYRLLVCEMTDIYGSYGKIGIALIELQPEYQRIKLLLMSCRVISRGVGSVLLSYIAQQCKHKEQRLLADFRPTGKNKMMLVAYRFAGFKEIDTMEDGTIVLEHKLNTIQPFPDFIQVIEA